MSNVPPISLLEFLTRPKRGLTRLNGWQRSHGRAFALWIGGAVYVLVGLGGSFLFVYYVYDASWRAMFLTLWWLPSGALAWWLRNRLENLLRGWAHEDSPS
jgi:hypothetical protein